MGSGWKLGIETLKDSEGVNETQNEVAKAMFHSLFRGEMSLDR